MPYGPESMLSGKEPLYVSALIHRAAHGPTPGIRLPTHAYPAEEAEALPAEPQDISCTDCDHSRCTDQRLRAAQCPKSSMAASSFPNIRPFQWWLPSAQGGSSGFLRHLGTGAASGNPLRRGRDQDHNQGAGAGQPGFPFLPPERSCSPD